MDSIAFNAVVLPIFAIMLIPNAIRNRKSGVWVRPMGDSYLQTAGYELLEQQQDRSVYERQRTTVQSTDTSTDTYAYQQGYITITPLKFDWTDHEFIDQVESWNLQLVD